MVRTHIFIDESGDLGLAGSKYLILAALITNCPDDFKRIIKNTRRNKFKKELKKANEIKANKSSRELKLHLLSKLNELKNLKVSFIVLEKKELRSKFLEDNKDKLYNFVAGKLAKNISLDCKDIEVRIDKSKGKQILIDDFNQYFEKKLKESCSTDKIEIFHSHSHSWAGIQMADLLAWCCFQKFENDNSEYLDVLKLLQPDVYYTW